MWQTPVGYVVCILIQITTILAATSIYAVVLIFFIGFCLFMANFGYDLKKTNLYEMNEALAKYQNSTVERMEMKKQFKDIIQFHSTARELVD